MLANKTWFGFAEITFKRVCVLTTPPFGLCQSPPFGLRWNFISAFSVCGFWVLFTYRTYKAKMTQYHNFWKFLAKKYYFGNKWQSITFSRTRFQKLKFLISFATVVLLSWICAIKKNYAVLELGKLEYHATQYSSIPALSTFKKKKKLHSTQAW